jgi:PAP2 superfamily
LASVAPSVGPAPRRLRLLALAVAPLRVVNRFAWFIDRSETSHSAGANRMRRGLALLFLGYGLILAVRALMDGAIPGVGQGILVMLALALLANRGGEFLRDLLAIGLGFFSYSLASKFAERLDFTVHYTPQIRFDKLLGFGSVPSVWLQSHLYHGHTGLLELFSLAMYVSHFIVPGIFAFALWWTRRTHAFRAFMFGLLTVSILGEITFVLAPTAPPWLAADHGYLPPVHHVLRQSLYHLHLNVLASHDGDASVYNIVAAVPSLHAAFPVVGLLVAIRYRLARWVRLALALHFLAVTFAIVYTGEHYVADALVGAVYAAAAWWIVARALGSEREAARVSPPPVAAPAASGRSAAG